MSTTTVRAGKKQAFAPSQSRTGAQVCEMMTWYLLAKSVHDGDVVWLGGVWIGEQDVVGHEFSRVQSELEPLVSDLFSVPQVLLGASQVGESGELPVK